MRESLLNLIKTESSRFILHDKDFILKVEMLAPVILNEEPIKLHFNDPYIKEINIGGIAGKINGDICTTNGLKINRELFLSDDKRYCAVRMSVTNKRQDAIKHDSLTPLFADQKGSIKIADSDFSDWRILKLSRFKGDIPGCFHPGKVDENYADVVFESKNITAGMGTAQNLDKHSQSDKIIAEPCIFIKNERSEERRVGKECRSRWSPYH